MTTSDVVIGGVIALFLMQHVRQAFLEQWHADRHATSRDLAQIVAGAASGRVFGAAAGVLTGDGSQTVTRSARSGQRAAARQVVSVGVRLGFLVWLYDVTDGAAFSPFAFAGDLVGGTVWQPVLLVLSLTEVVARVGAVAVRAVRTSGRRKHADPAVPVPTA